MDAVKKAISKVKAHTGWTNKQMDGYKVSDLMREADLISDSVLDKYEDEPITKYGAIEKPVMNEYRIGDKVTVNGKEGMITGLHLPSTVWRYRVRENDTINFYWEHELCR